ncbi:2OG-Fe(II) oxygenase [Actinosynnema sp. ALI-1.44]|uniref:2OG-Fe(II) oxygenase n=1 Tax=Actinosynnema sp. ALI-1.44 TaxID=1933779 RepID=UPI00143D820A|nr:2OG-Fe(II) oxygenase [Actinosynnema sp. ALI-1.44]
MPEPDRLVPQVFPVRMEGNVEDPPVQLPHRDGADSRHPLVTSVYYAQIDGAVGGELVLHDDDGRPTERIQPAEDHLVVVDGRQTHSVEPLTAGRRLAVVTNFYLPAGDR